MKRLHWLVTFLLAAVVVSDGVLTFRTWRTQSDADDRIREALVRTQPTAGLVSLSGNGLSADGTPFAPLDGGAGRVVRYAAKNCGYCERDAVWPRFAEAMRLRGVGVAVLLSGANEGFDPAGLIPATAPQVAFVSMEWVRQFRLTATPTVMLFNRAGALVWTQQGMLRPDSIDGAIRAMDRGRR